RRPRTARRGAATQIDTGHPDPDRVERDRLRRGDRHRREAPLHPRWWFFQAARAERRGLPRRPPAPTRVLPGFSPAVPPRWTPTSRTEHVRAVGAWHGRRAGVRLSAIPRDLSGRRILRQRRVVPVPRDRWGRGGRVRRDLRAARRVGLLQPAPTLESP